MSTFTVLQVNQIFMSRLGIYSRNFNENSNKFFKLIITYFISIAMILCIALSGWFIFENKTTDITSSLGAFKIMSAAIQCVGMFVCIGFKINQTRIFHLKLQRIVDMCMFFFIFFNLELKIFEIIIKRKNS